MTLYHKNIRSQVNANWLFDYYKRIYPQYHWALKTDGKRWSIHRRLKK